MPSEFRKRALVSDIMKSLNLGIFLNVLQNLYLFVPLLTMGLISREINNGTIKLLYSSPVKVRHIVLGKYLAMMIYNFLLLLVVGMFMVTGAFNIRSVDYGLLLSAALGFYLLICAYAAIGMFLSSLSTYQIVSAIGTFLVIFVLSRVSTLWQKYDLIRDLTYFLSMSGRTLKMLRGLITTNDVMYFALISYMFVSFTLFRLKGGRESSPWYKKAVRYLAVFALVLAIGYATSRPGYIGYFDATAGKINTIHDTTQQIIKKMGDEPIEVTLYTNLLGMGANRGFPQSRNDYMWSLWEKYIRFKPEMNFKYVMYYDSKDGDSSFYKSMPGKSLKEIAEQVATMYEVNLSRFIGPPEIRKIIDLQPENLRLVMQVKYKDRSMFLRTFDDAEFWPNEQQVAAAFKRLTEGAGPKVYFVTGDLERDINKSGEREYWGHTLRKDNRFALINHAFDFDTVSPDHRDIPADATTLVLADPKVDLSTTTTAKIKQYLDKGGNMMFLGEPGKQQVLNPVLKPLGVQLMDGTLIEITKNEMPHMVMPYATMASTELAQENMLREIKEALPRGDTIPILHPGASGIAYADSGFAVKHLMVTAHKNTWAKVGKLVTDSAPPVFEVREGDYKRDSFSTAVSLNRKVGNKEQRIIVVGDADFMGNLRGGGDFVARSYYCWLDYQRYPIYTPRPKPEDALLTIGPKVAKTQEIIYVWVLPGIVLLLGTILLIRRKRQ